MTFTTEQTQSPIEIEYPDHDGNPMSDNTEQFRWIVIIKENLEMMYADRPDVFVAGDLLWYPIEGDNKTRLAPDAMVAIGRPKGRRGSYMQWQEENIAPQIAFEILSPRNYQPEMERKRQFYETYGVEEYYSYDPDRDRLKGWIRQGSELLPISDMEGWVSPLMQIRFTFINKELKIYRPDGQKCLTSVELEDLAKHEREEKLAAQKRTRQALKETRLAQQALLQEQQRSQSQRNQIVINLLRSGMATQQIAEIAGCSVEQVEALRA
jgi:Uma2 family endonuclease/DNA-binding CsgD family transcriptional regulator